ncbi:MAG TPA: peptidoglycan DD-metalloendopeptidase family protein [Rubrobacter sp.]|nr:peptidoglycan DD-metalloendopeptidase family protein [Rubrobacter sp.]
MRRVSRFNLTHCGGLRGLAVLLGIVGAMCALSIAGNSVSSAEALRESKGPVERTEGEVVGASIPHPVKWFVERERYSYGQTYGFTLWRPDSGAPHDHGGTPAVRVALAYGLRPGQIRATVLEKLRAYPNLPMTREQVSVAEKGHRGVAVGPIPGSTPSTEVYVPVNGRVYQINVYGKTSGSDAKELLSTLRFEPPSRPVSSLGLPVANSVKTLYGAGDPELAERERTIHEATTEGEATFAASSLGEETPIEEGCWQADPDFFFQTQYGSTANANPEDSVPTGWTIIGRPNYWDEYTHGRLEYGRCDRRHYTNDKFAVDYLLDPGDAIFSPFRRGTVTFAGRNITHKDYGIFVSIKAANGKYVNVSGHLSRVAPGIRRGAVVDRNTVIGFAGRTGGGDIPVGPVHLHQAYYRYPTYTSDGAPYGGAGLKVVDHHYYRGDNGVYRFGWVERQGFKYKGSWISF